MGQVNVVLMRLLEVSTVQLVQGALKKHLYCCVSVFKEMRYWVDMSGERENIFWSLKLLIFFARSLP